MTTRLPKASFARATIALGLAVSLLLGDQQHGLSAAAATRPDPKFTPTKFDSIEGRTAKADPRPADPSANRAVRSAPVVRWPAAGTAEVAVPAPDAKGTWQLALNGGRVTDRARAGALPIWVGPTRAAAQQKLRSGTTDAPGKVHVELLGRRGNALELKVRRTDGPAKSGQVALAVDYREFRDAFGGDWATRLRFTHRRRGRTVVVPTRNNGNGEAIADLPVSAQTQTFQLAAGPSSGAGDYKKAADEGAATWSIGGSSGDFEWKQPLKVPPPANGPVPEMALTYSSGGLDGMSSASNNQPSTIGQGFSLSGGGAIERRFKPCSKDGEEGKGDQCFAGDSLNVSVAGKSGSLVLESRTQEREVWRMRGDDGSVIERLSGAENGDQGKEVKDRGEYWRMTTPNGTQYYFGLNRPDGWTDGKDTTNSTWTVPAYGNNSGEPCHGSSFADSWCQQAYQWNLDYVVDKFGNTMTLFYETETGRYARNADKTAVTEYVRAGNLKRIEYGQKHGQVYSRQPIAKVHFGMAERCEPAPCGPGQQERYPDTPWDQNCTGTTCEDHLSPTFWTQKRLDRVSTQVWRQATGKHEDVQAWSLRQEYLRGDNSSPALFLKEIIPVGLVGGRPLQMPATVFDGVAMANRVDTTSDKVPPLEWFRIAAVHNGIGGSAAVTYEAIDPGCKPTGLPAADKNTLRCRPQKWAPENSEQREDWFHKYRVAKVVETDRTVSASDPWQAPIPQVTTVRYLDKPAWRFEEQDVGTDLKESTWSQWRGYGKVQVIKGHEQETKTVTDSLYFRGMDADRDANGQPTDVKIEDSRGVKVDDTNEYSGQVREQISYRGAEVTSKLINDYYLSAPTATMKQPWGTLTSNRSGQQASVQFMQSDTGLVQLGTENRYDDAGRLTAKDERHGPGTADDTCTRFTYVENAAKNLLELPARQQVVSKSCDATFGNADVISDERLFYDNATTVTAEPERGLVTRAERLAGFDAAGQPRYELVHTATYDGAGRETSRTNAMNETVSKKFFPETGPVTKIVDRAPNGQETVTELEPAFGATISTTTASGLQESRELDAFGRVAKAWNAGSPRSGAADLEYEYLLRDNGATVVTTKRRVDGEVKDISHDLYDGLNRHRQTHERTPTTGTGWLVTDHRYDSRGNEVKVNGPYFTSVLAELELKTVDEATLPKQEVKTFDAAGRPQAQTVRSLGKDKWSVLHDVNTYRQTVDPPDGQTPTARITDPQGRLTELRHYRSGSPAGAYDSTKYTYWPGGRIKTVEDAAGNKWTYKYDLQGRKIEESDPDSGITRNEYDAADRLIASTDSRGRKIVTAYDVNGRKTALHKDSLQGPKLSEWTYDTLAPGMPTGSARFVTRDGVTSAYRTEITGYDGAGRPTGTKVTIPAAEGKLAGTYAIGQTYGDAGQLKTRTLPQVGDLAGETLKYSYNRKGLLNGLSGQDSYVRDLSYTPFKDANILTLGTANGPYVQQKFGYDKVTRRVNQVTVDKELAPERVSDTYYEYDPGGNITKVTDLAPNGSGAATDTQCFGYDHLRRLEKAWTPKPSPDNESGDCRAPPSVANLGGPAPYWQQWTFDKIGNRKTEERISAAGTTTSTYEYGTAKPHAVTSVQTTGPNGTSTKTFGYDETGNTTKRSDEVLEWDDLGLLVETRKGDKKTGAVYDADGQRLLRKDSSGTTLYIGETELQLDKAGAKLTGTRHYALGDQIVAVRTGGKLSWLLSDLQGTPNTAIDSVTQTVQRRRSTPYGETRGAPPVNWPGQRDFHKGISDPDTDLVHLGARQYDKSIGRFLSVDPLIDNTDPQQMQGYVYANNNPVSFVDQGGTNPVMIVVPVVRIVIQLVQIVVSIVELVEETRMVEQVQTVVDSVWSFFAMLWQQIERAIIILVAIVVLIYKTLEYIAEQVYTITEIAYETIMRDTPKVVEATKRSNYVPADPKEKAKQAGQSKKDEAYAERTRADPKQPPRPGREHDDEDENLYRGVDPAKGPAAPRLNVDYKMQPDGVHIMNNRGISVDTDADFLRLRNLEPWIVDKTSIDPRLEVRRTSTRPSHFEVVPRAGTQMTEQTYHSLIAQIRLTPNK
ncbi:RHS repeat protein [Kribbella sandramycini]|uniref:RHS repeat protein n=1 Tax=Kribbella sandramycini TaxID=60450 RepID=A0A7Y4L3K0_9ACTN|nr:RHS repeat protein [Kribbella sandramycini]MBB6570592.1 RHS repeat-associated protein [Kribbella sandramycini]NOL43738.1 RHS repeat protein [Kribbella sandramycini]